MALEALRVDGKERVDEAKQLHDALVLSDVFVALEQVLVGAAIGSLNGQFTRALLGVDDAEGGFEGDDADDRLAGGVGARRGEVEIVRRKELGGDVLQVEGGELRKLATNLPKDLVIEIPSLIEIADLAGSLECHTPLFRIVQIAAKCLVETYFTQGFRTLFLLAATTSKILEH